MNTTIIIIITLLVLRHIYSRLKGKGIKLQVLYEEWIYSWTKVRFFIVLFLVLYLVDTVLVCIYS